MPPIGRREYLKYTGSAAAAGPLVGAEGAAESRDAGQSGPAGELPPPRALQVEYADDPLGVEARPPAEGFSREDNEAANRQEGRPGSDWTDYTLEAEFTIEEQAAGFVFRAQDEGHCYMWQVFEAATEGDTRVYLLRPHVFDGGGGAGGYRVLDPTPFVRTSEDGWHTISIELDGNVFKTSVDGEHVDTTVDPTYASGTVGFRTASSEHMLVDAVTVTDPGGEELFATDFSHDSVQYFSGGRITDGKLELDGSGVVLRTDPDPPEEPWLPEPTFASRPRLSWQFEPGERGRTQRAYQVLVASSEQRLRADRGDRWDSGKVESGETTHVTYDGDPLESGERVHWKVRVWDEEGNASSWSEPSTWAMGLLDEADWAGDWIGDPRQHDPERADEPQEPAPLLRTEFALEQPVAEARVHVSGLGFYELHVNGERVGDQVLDPGRTNYLGTALYATHDVTDHLGRGDNALGVELGRARFGTIVPDTWNWEQAPWWSDPQLRLHLEVEYADGSTEVVGSDDTWRVADGPTRFDTIAPRWQQATESGLQEAYDARHERSGWTEPGFDDGDWDTAMSVEAPAGELTAQYHEPDEVTDTLAPVERTNPEADVYVFDLGQLFPGWPRLTVEGEAGTEVTLAVGEQLDDAGRVINLGHEFEYTLNGEGAETWHPRFSYSGFRYVEVRGFPGKPTAENVRADVVHNAVGEDNDSDFACSNELLTRIHENARWGMVNCLHGGVHEDTPTWEKNGWTEVLLEIGEDMIYNFDMARFYTKRLRDLQDALARSPAVGEEGELPVIVPSPDWGYGGWTPDPGWTSEFFELPWYMYQYYGDERVLEEHYEGLKQHLAYLGRHADGHIITAGLGDWGAPWIGNEPVVERGDYDAGQPQPPEGPAIVSTGHYYRNADLLSRIAGVLGREEEAARFAALSKNIAEAFNEEFLDPDDVYRTGQTPQYRQTSNLYPLAYDIVPDDRAEAVAENLALDVLVTHDGHLNTGAHGTMLLLEVLTEYGYHDAAYTVATRRTYPSWGLWIENDVTALLEFWAMNARSRTHDFLGSCVEWYYQYLAGLREPVEPGFDRVEIAPEPVDDLEWAEGATETPHGLLESRWEQTADEFALTATVPGTATGTIRVPDLGTDDVRVAEGGTTIWEGGEAAPPFPAGIKGASRGERAVAVEVGPGAYEFTLVPE